MAADNSDQDESDAKIEGDALLQLIRCQSDDEWSMIPAKGLWMVFGSLRSGLWATGKRRNRYSC